VRDCLRSPAVADDLLRITTQREIDFLIADRGVDESA
jgi:hypothetical protein